MKKEKIEPQARKWITKCAGRQKIGIILLAVFGVFVSLTGLFRALCYQKIVDLIEPVTKGASADGLIKWIIAFASVIILSILVSVVSSYVKESSTVNMLNEIRSEVMTALYKKEYKKTTEYHSGDLLNRMFSDARVISGNLVTLIPSALSLVVRLLGSFIFMYILAPKLALFLLLFGLLLSVFSFSVRKTLKRIHKETQAAEGKVRSVFQEQSIGLLMIKVFTADKKMKSRSDEVQKEYKSKLMRQRLISAFVHAVYMGSYNFAIIAVFIYSVYAIVNGSLSYGSLTAMLQLAGGLQASLNEIGGILPRYYSTLASAERILEITNLPDESEELCEIDKVEEICLSDVSFNYGREQLFENINLSVKKGEVVAIQGHSGIGKSTILLLLLGIYVPIRGKVLLKNDKCETQAGRGTRKFFSFVPQGNLLFSGTILENLLFSKETAEESVIKEALRISGSEEFVNQLPDGLNTKIGEGGAGLSEGQQQRLAIARALISDADILLLDEATSALDEKTEKEVIENLKSVNKTCILITHRKSPLSICDSAYILDEAGLNKAK